MNQQLELNRCENLDYRLPEKLREILNGFKYAVHEKNTSAVIIIDGRSGMGKTTLNNQCGKYCDENYDLSKIHYNPETFLNGGEGKIGLLQAKKGDWIVFDEAMLISNRSTLSAINRMIIQAMSMIRSKNIFVCFCVNSIFDLDKNLALSRADLLLHVYGQSLTDRGRFCAFFRGADGEDRLKMLYLLGKKFYDYSRPQSNFFARFPKNFVVNEEAYEQQKQIGVNNFLNSMTKQSNNKAQLSRDKLVLHLRKTTDLTIEEVANITGVSPRTIDNIIARYRT